MPRDLANFLLPSQGLTVSRASASSGGGCSVGTRAGRAGARARAINPDTNVPSVRTSADPGASTVVSLPRFGNLTVSVGSNVRSVIPATAEQFPRGYSHNLQRGDFGGFQCTSRGDARLLSLPPMPAAAGGGAKASAAAAAGDANGGVDGSAMATPDVSVIGAQQPSATLRDIWKFGMRAKAPLLTEVDPDTIGRPHRVPVASSSSSAAAAAADSPEDASASSAGAAASEATVEKVRIVRIRPEYLARGMVQPPQAEVVEVDRAVLENDAGHLMAPQQRRELMETQRKAREGLVALREVQAARTKLARTCQKLYPHGALGCSDGPYSEHPDERTYGVIAQGLQHEAAKVGRKGRKDAGANARPHETTAVVLNVGKRGEACTEVGPEQRRTGLAVRNVARPKDQLQAFAAGICE